MVRLPRLFRTCCSVPREKSHSCKFEIIKVVFLFILKMVYCVYSLESFHDKENREVIPSMPPDLVL